MQYQSVQSSKVMLRRAQAHTSTSAQVQSEVREMDDRVIRAPEHKRTRAQVDKK